MIKRPSRLARAVLAFVALPGLVAFVVPLLLAWPPSEEAPFRTVGLIPLAVGVFLLLWCVRDFYVSGKGTLAPWDPPRELVIVGLYRRSRNPMYIALSLILIGWSIGFRSWGLFVYALAVMAAFQLRVVLAEEPVLARTHRDTWKRYASRVPRWIFPNRKTLVLSMLGVALALPLAGLVFEAYADAKAVRDFPPPGMFVDVGGRKLHFVCIGDGEPIVMFEASGFGVSSLSASAVRERVATRTRVCSYDRMGMGWSDAGPGVVSAGQLALDLGVLQDRAELRGPFILVAASVGGLTVEMFARMYPERVAGLVFLDAGSSGSLRSLAPRFGVGRVFAPLVSLAARFGVIRLLDPFDLPDDSEAGRRSAAITYGARPIGTLGAIVRGMPASLAEFERAPPLPADVPLVVLSASDPNLTTPPGLGGIARLLRSSRLEVHQDLAKRSSRGSWRVVPKSDHLIANSQPDAVVDVIFKMLDERGRDTK